MLEGGKCFGNTKQEEGLGAWGQVPVISGVVRAGLTEERNEEGGFGLRAEHPGRASGRHKGFSQGSTGPCKNSDTVVGCVGLPAAAYSPDAPCSKVYQVPAVCWVHLPCVWVVG